MEYAAFVDAVRNRPCIYNYKRREYRDLGIKERAWTEIALETSQTVEECKKIWRYLRDRFVRERNKMKDTPNGGADMDESYTWEYFEPLEFLVDFIKPRNQPANRRFAAGSRTPGHGGYTTGCGTPSPEPEYAQDICDIVLNGGASEVENEVEVPEIETQQSQSNVASGNQKVLATKQGLKGTIPTMALDAPTTGPTRTNTRFAKQKRRLQVTESEALSTGIEREILNLLKKKRELDECDHIGSIVAGWLRRIPHVKRLTVTVELMTVLKNAVEQ